jgi:5-aminopentanamidase
MQAGVFQCAGGGLTQAGRLDQLDVALAGQNLDLVVCPELFTSGYNVGEDLTRLAVPVGGDLFGKMSALAVKHKTAIAFGYPERSDEAIYNSAACINAAGEIVANQRKLSLPPGSEASYFTPGDSLDLFDLGGLRCCILICYDAEHPETVRAAAEAGAQLIIVPTALVDAWPTVTWQMMPTRAFENGVWLIYANHAGQENGMNYLGASCIVAPDGTDAARAGDKQELIQAEIDVASVATAQARLPYLDTVKDLRPILNKN